MPKIRVLILIIPLIFMSCMNKKGNGNFGAANKKEQAIIVMVQDMQPGNLEKYVRITGKLEGITDVILTSETNGKVVEISNNLGDWIEKGESIGRIDNSDYQNQVLQAEANLLAAEAALETAQIQMQVSETLFKEEKISRSEYLQNSSLLKSAEAGFKGASAQIESSKKSYENSRFIAPVSGYLAELNLEIGEFVNSGKVYGSIVDSRSLKIKTGVGETDISYIKKGNSVIIDYNGKKFPAKVTGVGIRPATGGNNYPIEIEMANPGNALLPGMVVQGNIHAKTFQDVLSTSIENLREKYDQSFVYMIDQENKAELRIVELGEKVGQKVILKSGIRVGEKLVIDGIDSLNNDSLVEIKSF
ncbi:MAG: efflux RND transporter periplasmic adaptor subunit [Candidatus Cloacimonetes bacterium]|nr:efflux RND transporter periplasmic adaptor subunit [Candidatus Cloacimonadota bacterium]